MKAPSLAEKTKEQLRSQQERLDPVALLQRIRQGQTALAALSTGAPSEGPERENLNQFLAGLPELWRQGEVRATHRKTARKARYWRTRSDPFEKVWADILLWLQKDPDHAAKGLLGRLNEKYPGQFSPKLLRTLQRRVGEWRHTMARSLVLGGVEEQKDVQPVAVAVPRQAEAKTKKLPYLRRIDLGNIAK